MRSHPLYKPDYDSTKLFHLQCLLSGTVLEDTHIHGSDSHFPVLNVLMAESELCLFTAPNNQNSTINSAQ